MAEREPSFSAAGSLNLLIRSRDLLRWVETPLLQLALTEAEIDIRSMSWTTTSHVCLRRRRYVDTHAKVYVFDDIHSPIVKSSGSRSRAIGSPEAYIETFAQLLPNCWA